MFRKLIPVLTLAILAALVLSCGCTGDSSKSTPEERAASPTQGMPVSSGDLTVAVQTMDTVMPGVYFQMPNQNITFIDFDITNSGTNAARVTVESEISGYSEKAISTVEVPPGQTILVSQTPVLKTGSIPRELTNAQIHYKVSSAGGNVIAEETIPVRIYAKDTMVWEIRDGNESADMSGYIGAWVMPHASGIDSLIRKSADYQPQRSMSGYQCGNDCTADEWKEYTNSQVKAMYTALQKDYDITYISSGTSFSTSSDSTQRVRLPEDSLQTKSANCIDGTVLYASALESIEINPHIILLPSHAFVCYDTSDTAADELVCLETTMTGSATFEEAVSEGNQEYEEEITNGNFKSGKSQDLDLRELRSRGILPMQ